MGHYTKVCVKVIKKNEQDKTNQQSSNMAIDKMSKFTYREECKSCLMAV